MNKKLLSTVLAMCMVATLFFPSMSTYANAEGTSGEIALSDITTIESGKTYTIKSVDELNHFSALVNGGQTCEGATIKLLNDIALGYWHDGNSDGIEDAGEIYTSESYKTVCTESNWTPIGTQSNPFAGVFDGDSHTLSGICINNTKSNYVGLFGYVNSGTVKSVGVEKSYIKGANQVGGVCGINFGGTVTCCYNTGCVIGTGNGTNNYVGGVCGQNDLGEGTASLTNCYNMGNVKLIPENNNPKAVGGVCGKNYSGNSGTVDLTNCYNAGNVTGTDHVGGMCGWNKSTGGSARITNCYNTGNVEGILKDVGGICGLNEKAVIENCYNTGTICGTDKPIGAIAGYNPGGSIGNTYYCGYDVGIGGEDAPQDGTTPFVKIKDNPLGIGKATDFIEHSTLSATKNNIREVWGTALGNSFEVQYEKPYISSDSNIAEIRYDAMNEVYHIEGVAEGNTEIKGKMTITQNSLSTEGFTGTPKQISVNLSIPLTVTKGTQDALWIPNIPDSVAYGDDNFTLSTIGGSGTGEVTYSSSDPTVLTVDETTGEVTVVGGAGESATITATKAGDDNYNSVTASALIEIDKAYQSRIDSIAYSAESVDGKNDGAIFWVDDTMEYRPLGGEYIGVSGTQVVNLSPGTYEVRYKETENYNPSNALTLTIRKGVPQTYTITTSDITFDDKDYGYEDINTKPLEITSEGNWETTIKEVSISGDAFELNKTSGATIASGATDNSTYTVKPKSSLDAGDYEETVTIVYNNDEQITSKVRFHVNVKGHTGGGTYIPPVEPDTGADIIVNGKKQTAGDAETSEKNGQTVTTVTVDTEKLQKVLEAEGQGAAVIIPVKSDSDVATGALNGQMVKDMETQQATLEIQTSSATYTLPASEIDIDSVSKQYGEEVTLSNINVEITIAEPSDKTVSVVEDAADEGEFAIMVPAVDFTISCTYNGQTTSVTSFNSYVERMVAIPDGVDPTKITTGIVVHADGTTHHVPTQVTVIDGKYYAVINSLTNSTYTVIYNPVEFSDVTAHWAKESINNMGSRMVVNGVDDHNYAPDKDITRAEVATIVVRALGLEKGVGEEAFTDVNETDWFCGYVKTAASYGLVKGYGDGTFKPNDKITREQVMAIIARAMEKTGLETIVTEEETNELLSDYSDSTSVSSYAKTSVAKCVRTGVVKGRTKTALAPRDNISRAEVAVIVERLLQKSDLI